MAPVPEDWPAAPPATGHDTNDAVAARKQAATAHSDAANTALGVSIGAAVGALVGVSVLPGVGLALFPAAAALIGGVLGNHATRIASRLHGSH